MFSNYRRAKIRLEGHTRQDNFAMRKTFERAGFVKEAQLRQAWFSPKEESYYDAVTYGMTREDFEEGTTTPVVWEDGRISRRDIRLNHVRKYQIFRKHLNRND